MNRPFRPLHTWSMQCASLSWSQRKKKSVYIHDCFCLLSWWPIYNTVCKASVCGYVNYVTPNVFLKSPILGLFLYVFSFLSIFLYKYSLKQLIRFWVACRDGISDLWHLSHWVMNRKNHIHTTLLCLFTW